MTTTPNPSNPSNPGGYLPKLTGPTTTTTVQDVGEGAPVRGNHPDRWGVWENSGEMPPDYLAALQEALAGHGITVLDRSETGVGLDWPGLRFDDDTEEGEQVWAVWGIDPDTVGIYHYAGKDDHGGPVTQLRTLVVDRADPHQVAADLADAYPGRAPRHDRPVVAVLDEAARVPARLLAALLTPGPEGTANPGPAARAEMAGWARDELIDAHATLLGEIHDIDFHRWSDGPATRGTLLARLTAPAAPGRVLVATRGLPGSGKTTWANACLARLNRDGIPAVRVSRDDVRAGLALDPATTTPGQEAQVTTVHHGRIRAAFTRATVVVLVDDTHLHDEYLAATITAAGPAVTVVVADFRHLPVQACTARDATRAGAARVGADRITALAARHGLPTTSPGPDNTGNGSTGNGSTGDGAGDPPTPLPLPSPFLVGGSFPGVPENLDSPDRSHR